MRGDQVCAASVKAQIPTKVPILSAGAEAPDVLAEVKVPAWLGWSWRSSADWRRTGCPERREVSELTDRETEVLKLVAGGMPNNQIGVPLFISHGTVQNHVQNTVNKLLLHNRIELVRLAIAQGLDTPTSSPHRGGEVPSSRAPLNAGGSDVAMEELTLEYERHEME